MAGVYPGRLVLRCPPGRAIPCRAGSNIRHLVNSSCHPGGLCVRFFQCVICSVWFGIPVRRGRSRVTCGEQCRLAHRKIAYGGPDSETEKCGKDNCDRPLRAKGLCNMHYKAVLRAEGRIKPSVWDDRRKNNYHARRARKASSAVPGEVVTIDFLMDRDDCVCGICGLHVDRSEEYPSPLSPSIDHVIPLARGGAHSLSNCQPAHLSCNVSKGDRVSPSLAL